MEPLKSHTLSSEQGAASPNHRASIQLDSIITKVLIVEDDEDIAQLLHYAFKKQGFSPLISYDGLEALDIAEREHPDIILLDILLPKLGWTRGMQIPPHPPR